VVWAYCPALTSLGSVVATASSVERIRDAALRRFAEIGTAATSLREIANGAGVSIGLVQHHFGSKAGLIAAVDEYVLATLSAKLVGAPNAAQANPVNAVGNRVIGLITDHPDVVDYVGRVLIDGNEIGSVIFDALTAIGEARWKQHAEQHLTRDDLDLTWAALNPIIMVLGAITLRAHIDRHLPEPFTTTAQLARWENAMNTLIGHGQLRPELETDT
jgi:AcrR family transcriptional regulator